MPRHVPFAVLAVLTATFAWSGRLVFGGSPWDSEAAALLAADLIVLGAVVAVAALLDPGRWVRMMIAVLGAVWALLAVALEADQWWIAGVTAGLLGVAGAWGRPADAWFAGSTKPDRVPARASALAIGLLATPGLVAFTSSPALSARGWMLAALTAFGAFAYARALPGSLWLGRLLVPMAFVVAVVGLDLAAAVALAAGGVVVTGLAWSADARLAVEPLTPRKVESVSVLPEMVPGELMEGAGYDRRGRPRGER